MNTLTMKKNSRKYYILTILYGELREHRYGEFYQLCEAANITNDELVRKLHTRRNLGLPFREMIYYDMMMVLIDRVMEDSALEELFSQLFKPRFPKATELYSDVCAYYVKYKKTTLPDAICDRKDALNKNEDNFFQYLLGRDDTPFTIERSASDYNNQMKYMDFLFYMTEDEALDKVLNVIKFKNSDESVYPSRQYDRLIKLRKEKLAEYLQVDENQLASTIHAIMDIDKTETGAALRRGIGGLIEQVGKRTITSQNGSWGWHDELIAPTSIIKSSPEYKPDVEKIIDNYYKSVMISDILPEVDKNNIEKVYESKYTKIEIARGSFCGSIENDYQAILYMYEMSRIYKMFAVMMEQYYRDFSWEKITGKNFEQRYQMIVNDYKNVVSTKDAQIASLARENESLSIKQIGDKDEIAKKYEAQVKKLNKDVEDREHEILRLKGQIAAQNEFIELLNKPEEQEIEFEPDIEALQTKRYLFVGAADEALPELRRKFPNSKFAISETTNISAVEVDAVVFLIRWMSHSMFYKIKSITKLAELPWVYCNTKSFNQICYDMQSGLF